MDCELPTEYELIVVGTGMIESIIAAAASRIGKRILHLDRNDYYGGQWASFNLDTIHKLATVHHRSGDDVQNMVNKLIGDGEQFILLGNNSFDIKHVAQNWHIPKQVESTALGEEDKLDSEDSLDLETVETSAILTQEVLQKDSRKFNIDLAPKLQFSRGNFVELLISSNIARYSEFRCISRVLTVLNKQLEVVPCSRSDVFSNTKVSVVEKRMLMKLITTILDGKDADFQGYSNKTFLNYLKDKKLTPNLEHYVLYAIAMSNKETSFFDGVHNMKRFLESLGRYGKTPLLYSMYGSGEMPQAFCRLSAVFGGIYALNQHIHGLILSEDKLFCALLSGTQKLSAPHLVIGAGYAPTSYLDELPAIDYISHGIFITDSSILPSDKENLTLLLYPPEDDRPACIIIEMGPATGTCPNQYFMTHIYTKQQHNPKDDLNHCVKMLFDNNRGPKILWSLYYSIPNLASINIQNRVPKNVYICDGPDSDIDFDTTVEKAKAIFTRIYPDEEFLPRAPDPEEIIIGDEDNDGDKYKDDKGRFSAEQNQTKIEDAPNKDQNAEADFRVEEDATK